MRTAQTRTAARAARACGVARESAWLLPATAAVTLVLSGCPIDERDLDPDASGGAAQGARAGSSPRAGDGGRAEGGVAQGGAAGSGTAGGAADAGKGGLDGSSGEAPSDAGTPGVPGAGTGGTTCPPGPTGGRAGAGGNGPGPCSCGGNGSVGGAPVCPDLDGNQVLDCDETSVMNAGFDADTLHWMDEQGMISAWIESDAHARDDSGAIVIENNYEDDIDGQFMTGVRQCLEISEPAIFRVAAEILVPEGQEEGNGAVQLLLYDQVGCAGQVVTSGIANAVAAGDAWKVITVTRASPPAAKSLALRLVAVKPYSGKSFRVLFDNVLVRTE